MSELLSVDKEIHKQVVYNLLIEENGEPNASKRF